MNTLRILSCITLIACIVSCASAKKVVNVQAQEPLPPIMTFDESLIDLGEMKQGEKRKLVFRFTNTGGSPLLIELATTCKCTDITWPTKTIAPGESGEINAVFDSSDFEGPVTKSIDIIANTDPIVVEAKFKAEVVLP